MYAEFRSDHDTDWEAMGKVSELLGVGQETLRKWVRQAEVDQGARPGNASEESAEVKLWRRESGELRRANVILRAASAFFASIAEPRLAEPRHPCRSRNTSADSNHTKDDGSTGRRALIAKPVGDRGSCPQIGHHRGTLGERELDEDMADGAVPGHDFTQHRVEVDAALAEPHEGAGSGAFAVLEVDLDDASRELLRNRDQVMSGGGEMAGVEAHPDGGGIDLRENGAIVLGMLQDVARMVFQSDGHPAFLRHRSDDPQQRNDRIESAP